MDINPQFKAKIINKNELIFENETDFYNYANALNCGDYSIVVKKWRDKRSNKSNRYLWAIYNIIAQELGYNKFEVEDLHFTFKKMFLPKEMKTDLFKGEEIEVAGSTRKLNSLEFSNYVNEVKMYAEKELNIVIPDINSIDY